MAIDGSIIDVCFFVVRCVHELIPALNYARVHCERLQDQKFRDGERNRLALPDTSLTLRVYTQMTPLQYFGRRALAGARDRFRYNSAQQDFDPLNQNTTRKWLANEVVGFKRDRDRRQDIVVIIDESNG